MIFTSRIIAFLSREAILGRSTDVRFENEKKFGANGKKLMHSAFWQLGKILIRELFLGLQTMDKCVHLVAGDSAESFLITPRPLLSRSWAVVPSSTTRLITLTTLTNIIINQITITALVVNHSPYHSLSPLTANIIINKITITDDSIKKSLGKLPMPTVVNW